MMVGGWGNFFQKEFPQNIDRLSKQSLIEVTTKDDATPPVYVLQRHPPRY